MGKVQFDELVKQIENETARLLTVITALDVLLKMSNKDPDTVYLVGRAMDAIRPQYGRLVAARRDLHLSGEALTMSAFFNLGVTAE